MKPTWVLSEEERQRRFRKNREKQESGGGGQRGKGGRTRGNSLNDLSDFDLMEGTSLTDSLPGLLLLEQAAEERSRESLPVILEKLPQPQQPVRVKSEVPGPSLDRLGQQELNNYFILPPGESSKPLQQQTTSFFVKAEPNPSYSSVPYPAPEQQRSVVVRTTAAPQPHPQPSVLFVTSASQFAPRPQHQLGHFTAPRGCAPQHQQHPRPAFLSTKPSVIVQPASPSLPARTFQYRSTSVDFAAPESRFPLEIGPFASVEAELVSPGQAYEHPPAALGQEVPAAPLSQEEYERQLNEGLEYVDSVYSDSSEDDEADAERERLLREPEIKFSEMEEVQLATLVKQHDERYRSVNFGEELIKEMIMCR